MIWAEKQIDLRHQLIVRIGRERTIQSHELNRIFRQVFQCLTAALESGSCSGWTRDA